MKSFVWFALLAAIALVAVPALAGETATAEKAAEVKTEAKAEKITGTIAKIDTAARAIEVKEGERVVNLKLEEKTEIHRGKEMLKLADLKVGDKVEVEAHGTIARHITLKAAEPAKY